ncbi:MAG: NADP-dependent malic enzyme [Clostridia bacterium]|nr:NADP-dependent malic enzyme [Clostridia bacterium]
MDYNKEALRLHKEHMGKIEMRSLVPVKTRDDLSTAYTPGVAAPCLEIKEHPHTVYEYTRKGNMVAVVSDGTAVLGLGDIGAKAAIPVMEGKAVLFKEFGNVDAVPICLDTTDVDEIVKTVKYISPMFGGINLEDISAPRCFEVEDRLKAELDIPVFHDDQHGTAVVVLAALINACRLTGRKIEELNAVFSGAGAAGSAICRLLVKVGLKSAVLTDSKGIVYRGRAKMNANLEKMLEITNKENKQGSLTDALCGADLFIGVSKGGLVSADDIKLMNKNPIIFPMANPVPEIMPDEAKAAGAAVVGTGRSDFPNQINNVLAFPGIFRGALDARAKMITEEMKIAAAKAIAAKVSDSELCAEYIIPPATDKSVAEAVAKAVYTAAKNG